MRIKNANQVDLEIYDKNNVKNIFQKRFQVGLIMKLNLFNKKFKYSRNKYKIKN